MSNRKPHAWRTRAARGFMLSAMMVSIGLLSACLTQEQRIEKHEDALSAAGFIVKAANTPDRQTMLHRLPPNKFVRRVNGDVVTYVYADPIACGCLYVGSQQAYNQYMSNQLQQNLIDQQQMAAQMYQDEAWNWGAWGPWGPVGPLGPYYGPGLGW
jgi:hypothetical protein